VKNRQALFIKATCSVEITHPCVLYPAALGGPLSAVDSWVADIALSNIKFPVHRIPLSFFGSEIPLLSRSPPHPHSSSFILVTTRETGH